MMTQFANSRAHANSARHPCMESDSPRNMCRFVQTNDSVQFSRDSDSNLRKFPRRPHLDLLHNRVPAVAMRAHIVFVQILLRDVHSKEQDRNQTEVQYRHYPALGWCDFKI